MRVDKGSKRIVNLDSISNFGKSWCIKCRDWWDDEQAKFDFLVAIVTACREKFKNNILLNSDRNYRVLVLKLNSECLVFGKINLTHRFKYS